MLVYTMWQKEIDAVKERGAYYTPKAISDFLVNWGLEKSIPPMNMLEPSCGDGVFLKSLSESLRLRKNSNAKVLAIEMNKNEAKKARKVAKSLKEIPKTTSNVVTSEYFEYMRGSNRRAMRKFDLILGNPPYIKQSKFIEGRTQALCRMEELGLKINQQSNAWVYFVIDTISRMSSNSRIGLVIPSDLLQLDYANKVQDWITRNLDNTLIIGFDELVFPNIQQDVILLLGEKINNSKGKRLSLVSVENASKLSNELWDKFLHSIQPIDIKNVDWDLQYLSDYQLSTIEQISAKTEVSIFGDIADLKIGIVTGANKFFCVDKEKLSDLNLRRGSNKGIVVRKLIGARINIIGIEYRDTDHEKNHSENQSTNLLDFNPKFNRTKLSGKMQRYLESGEKLLYHERNQLRRRYPWYSSEHVLTTRIGMYKRSNDYCKLILKPSNIYSTDTVYRVLLSEHYVGRITPKQFVFSFVNSLTYLFCEMKGRSYGGGVLELTPKEIRTLKIPLYKCTDEEFSILDKMFRKNQPIDKILDYSDGIILKFLTESEKIVLRTCWEKLKSRRLQRPKRRG